jgi:hypothetical protein
LNKEDALAFKLIQANAGSEEQSGEELSETDLIIDNSQPTKLI